MSEKLQQGTPAENCCGGPAPSETDSCCIADADAKAAGYDGCGCEVPGGSKKENTNPCC